MNVAITLRGPRYASCGSHYGKRTLRAQYAALTAHSCSIHSAYNVVKFYFERSEPGSYWKEAGGGADPKTRDPLSPQSWSPRFRAIFATSARSFRRD
jgi:hypothetical protein